MSVDVPTPARGVGSSKGRRRQSTNVPAHPDYRDGEGPEEGTPEFDAEMEVWGALNDELRAPGGCSRRAA